MAPNTKKDLGQHRQEIEQLTAAGESCENIAALLRSKGIDISSKTVSRYRVNWGLRQRAEPATKGRTCMCLSVQLLVMLGVLWNGEGPATLILVQASAHSPIDVIHRRGYSLLRTLMHSRSSFLMKAAGFTVSAA